MGEIKKAPKANKIDVDHKAKNNVENHREFVPQFRYFCDACTNIAGVFADKDYRTIECEVCGKVQTAKVENYLNL
jgi:ribosomal protein S27E